MNVGDSVRKAIDDWDHNDLDAAILHTFNAVDGTAKKFSSTITRNNARFTQFLRANYDVFGPMGIPGQDLVTQRWPVTVRNSTTSDGKPDIADVI